jgi:hypothetical protein
MLTSVVFFTTLRYWLVIGGTMIRRDCGMITSRRVAPGLNPSA